MLPVAFGEGEECGDFLVGDVVDKAADCACFLEPVALPEFAWSYALIGCCLVVRATGHGSFICDQTYVQDA